jgi:hypothetical protein
VKLVLLIMGLLAAPDALAWGLQTHVSLAQWALAAVPLADPQLRAATLRLPRLVLAGACLPDLALAGRILSLAEFRVAHRWSTLRRLAAACWDEERAVAVGYASHLLADVIAHNRFVPEHEARIADIAHFTHALCEWAMDEHVRRGLEVEPAALLASEGAILAEAAARTFRCRTAVARRGIIFLMHAERALRASRLPRLCRRLLDVGGFDAYLGDAKLFVRRLEAVMSGAEPLLEPDPDQATANEAPAIAAPSAAPASTSLG